MSRFGFRTRNGAISSFIEGIVGTTTDVDAQAFYDRVTAAGGTLTTTEKDAVNVLVLSLKTNSLWTLMKVIYPMVGASAAACAQNLKSSSFTGTFTSGWTFASAGVTPNGTSAFFNTNFNNQSNWTSTSNGSMGFISETNQSGTVCDMGSGANISNGANSTTIYANFSGTFYGGMNCTVVTPGSVNTSSIGFFVATRLTTTAYNLYKRGSSTINLTTTDSIGTNPNSNIYLGAGNDSATNQAQSFSNKRYNFCFLGDGLTQAQVDTYYSILQTFNTSLSR
jgi:hypothetical protein